jgi:hypothetical protein
MFGTLFALAIAPPVDPDLGWHLGAGRWIATERRIPFTDPFSWSVPGRKWIAHEWLTEIAMHGIYRLGGDGLLVVIWAAIITAAWALLYRTTRIAGAGRLSGALLTGLGAISTVHTWGVRPQMLTLLLVMYTGMRFTTWRVHGGRTPWELIPIMAVWANLHGGYIFGVAMALAYACGSLGEFVIERLAPKYAHRSLSRVRNSWLLFVGLLGVTLATPNTIDGLMYPFTYLGDNASTRYVGEWFAPNFRNVQFWPFAAVLVLLVLAVIVGIRNRSIGLTELGLTLPFAVMGLQSARNVSQTIVCAIPVIALAPRRAPRSKSTRRSPRPNEVSANQRATIAAVTASALVLALVAQTRTDLTEGGIRRARQQQYPLRATTWITENPKLTTRVFNHYNYGGWLVLQGVPVFIDGRPDMYGDAFVDDYVRFTGAAVADWQSTMTSLKADAVLMPVGSAMTKQIDADIAAGRAPLWYEPITDPQARLFVRRMTR